jgi:hypothetical protein
MEITVCRPGSRRWPRWLLGLLGLEYRYGIEERLDEDRYWYWEKKGWRRESHHSKQRTAEDAAKIVREIAARAKAAGYEVKVVLDCAPHRRQLAEGAIFLTKEKGRQEVEDGESYDD